MYTRQDVTSQTDNVLIKAEATYVTIRFAT